MKKNIVILLLVSLVSCVNLNNNSKEPKSFEDYLKTPTTTTKVNISASIAPTPSPTPTPKPKLLPLINMLNGFTIGITFVPSFVLNIEKYKAFTNIEALNYIKNLSTQKTIDGEMLSYVKEDQNFYIKQYIKNIESLFSKLNLVDGNIIYFEPDTLPVQFSEFQNTTCFIVSSAEISIVLNSLKLNENERIIKALKEYSLPILYNFQTSFNDSDVKYLGFTITYGVRDFSTDEKDALNTNQEVVSIVFSKADLNKFINAELSDNDFIKKSNILLKSKVSRYFKKVDLFQ